MKQILNLFHDGIEALKIVVQFIAKHASNNNIEETTSSLVESIWNYQQLESENQLQRYVGNSNPYW